MISKKLFIGLSCVLFLSVSAFAEQTLLPKGCLKALNFKFKKWKMAEISPSILEWYQKSKQKFPPEFNKRRLER